MSDFLISDVNNKIFDWHKRGQLHKSYRGHDLSIVDFGYKSKDSNYFGADTFRLSWKVDSIDTPYVNSLDDTNLFRLYETFPKLFESIRIGTRDGMTPFEFLKLLEESGFTDITSYNEEWPRERTQLENYSLVKVKEILILASDALGIASDWNVDKVEVYPPSYLNLTVLPDADYENDEENGWCDTRELSEKLREVANTIGDI